MTDTGSNPVRAAVSNYDRTVKYCPRCQTSKPFEQFNVSRERKDGHQPYCRECTKEINNSGYRNGARKQQVRDAAIRAKAKAAQFLYEYLLDHPCTDCGERDVVVLQFDHVHGKAWDISALMTCSIPRIQLELVKCEVRCANCHVRATAERHGGWWRSWIGVAAAQRILDPPARVRPSHPVRFLTSTMAVRRPVKARVPGSSPGWGAGPDSSNGRTAASGAVNRGSSP